LRRRPSTLNLIAYPIGEMQGLLGVKGMANLPAYQPRTEFHPVQSLEAFSHGLPGSVRRSAEKSTAPARFAKVSGLD
jgi:hypothetical protein